MPDVIEKINKLLYVPSEIELLPKLEDIIFRFNIQFGDEFTKGAEFDNIITELNKIGLRYNPILILSILKRMKNDGILFETDGKWYSTMM